MSERTIADMTIGETAFTTPWGMWLDTKGHFWLHPDYIAHKRRSVGEGTIQMRVTRRELGYQVHPPADEVYSPTLKAGYNSPSDTTYLPVITVDGSFIVTTHDVTPEPAYANTDLRVVYHAPNPELERLKTLRAGTARARRWRPYAIVCIVVCVVVCVVAAVAWWQFDTSNPDPAIPPYTLVERDVLQTRMRDERLGYVYVMRAGKYAGYYSVKGKVTRNKGGDGSFFFTTSGTMVETTLDWLYVTKRLRNVSHVPRIG